MNIVHFACDYCGGPGTDRASEYAKKKRHFCKRQCYTNYRREIMPAEEQNAWKGGIAPEESRRRWAEKHKAKIKAMAQARRLRELNAPGSHTQEEWEAIKHSFNNECAEKGQDHECSGPITKDHKIPLIMGGSNNPDNLQPLCRRRNSQKARRVQLEFSNK